MENYNTHKVTTLHAKGGIMLFTVEREQRLYKGTIVLSPVEGNYQRRAVYIKEYKFKTDSDN